MSSDGVEVFLVAADFVFFSFPTNIAFHAVVAAVFLCLKLPPPPPPFFPPPPGSSMTVWYLAGRLSGPPPTSMYFWFSMLLQAVSARFRASSSDISLVGVEMASDLGRFLAAAVAAARIVEVAVSGPPEDGAGLLLL